LIVRQIQPLLAALIDAIKPIANVDLDSDIEIIGFCEEFHPVGGHIHTSLTPIIPMRPRRIHHPTHLLVNALPSKCE
jgi:hypothetical protein